MIVYGCHEFNLRSSIATVPQTRPVNFMCVYLSQVNIFVSVNLNSLAAVKEFQKGVNGKVPFVSTSQLK